MNRLKIRSNAIKFALRRFLCFAQLFKDSPLIHTHSLPFSFSHTHIQCFNITPFYYLSSPIIHWRFILSLSQLQNWTLSENKKQDMTFLSHTPRVPHTKKNVITYDIVGFLGWAEDDRRLCDEDDSGQERGSRPYPEQPTMLLTSFVVFYVIFFLKTGREEMNRNWAALHFWLNSFKIISSSTYKNKEINSPFKLN